MPDCQTMEPLFYSFVQTVHGYCALLWHHNEKGRRRLLRLYSACPDHRALLRGIHDEYPTTDAIHSDLPSWLKPVRRFLLAYYSGDRDAAARAQLSWPWLQEHLYWAGQTEFGHKVLAATFAIKPGTTLSYGKLARQIGRPNAARAVGGALARNPWPVIIPCHRVLGSDGSMTGFSGYGAVKAKKWMLKMEREA